MPRREGFVVAVLGATGAVGQEMLRILEERRFPVSELRPLASRRSAGRALRFRGRRVRIREATPASFAGADLVLASAGAELSRRLLPAAVRAGAVAVDNSSAYRQDPAVPLVVPEINPEALRRHRGIIANPNCTTILLLVPLAPLDRAARLRRVRVATYQAVSGAGAQAMRELHGETLAFLKGRRPGARKVFPHPIAFNLFTHESAVDASGYNQEERKVAAESRKILGRPGLSLSATCVRVPVFRAHSEAVFAEFERDLSPARARALLARAPGVRLVDDARRSRFPMPVEATGEDDVLVGRVRREDGGRRALAFFLSGDQLRKGAALNAVQIAELLVERKLLKR